MLSLLDMVALLLPWIAPATDHPLKIYDLIMRVLLFDFGPQTRRTPSARAYFLHKGGWPDLLGSIPSFGTAIVVPHGELTAIRERLSGDVQTRHAPEGPRHGY